MRCGDDTGRRSATGELTSVGASCPESETWPEDGALSRWVTFQWGASHVTAVAAVPSCAWRFSYAARYALNLVPKSWMSWTVRLARHRWCTSDETRPRGRSFRATENRLSTMSSKATTASYAPRAGPVTARPDRANARSRNRSWISALVPS